MLWIGLALLNSPIFAEDNRTLYWDTLEVTAYLDASGRLYVKERQGIVFDGAWNGGERNFNVSARQELRFEALSRVIPRTGALIALTPGNMEKVDEYQWSPDDHNLRWHSRLPSDPPFKKTKITYQLEYTYSNIILQEGDTYLLNHDFSFPNRKGDIRYFKLDFSWDERWSTPSSFSGKLVRDNLRPGESVIVEAAFGYQGPVPPESVVKRLTTNTRYAFMAVLLILCGGVFVSFYRDELSLQKEGPPIPMDKINEAWLQDHVFSLLPEMVGAAWDDSTNAAEVSACLARMEMEGKLRSEVKNQEMYLELLVEPGDLKGYEAKLIKALFVKGKQTNAALLREHYHRRGFDPARILQRALRWNTSKFMGVKIPYLWVGLLGVGVSGATLLLRGEFEPEAAGVWGPLTFLASIFSFIGGVALAVFHQWEPPNGSLRLLRRHTLKFLLKIIPVPLLVSWFLVADPFLMPIIKFLGILLLTVAIFSAVIVMARSGITREQAARMRKLIAAREYFQQELRKPAPRIKNEWYPYLVAFELTKDMSRWFSVHGKAAHSPTSNFADVELSRDEKNSETTTPKSTSWSGGGGGSFGGGGATGDWAASAATLAKIIPAPIRSSSSSWGNGSSSSSSSSSRSSSSSSSRSSGGGGGGGW